MTAIIHTCRQASERASQGPPFGNPLSNWNEPVRVRLFSFESQNRNVQEWKGVDNLIDGC